MNYLFYTLITIKKHQAFNIILWLFVSNQLHFIAEAVNTNNLHVTMTFYICNKLTLNYPVLGTLPSYIVRFDPSPNFFFPPSPRKILSRTAIYYNTYTQIHIIASLLHIAILRATLFQYYRCIYYNVQCITFVHNCNLNKHTKFITLSVLRYARQFLRIF